MMYRLHPNFFLAPSLRRSCWWRRLSSPDGMPSPPPRTPTSWKFKHSFALSAQSFPPAPSRPGAPSRPCGARRHGEMLPQMQSLSSSSLPAASTLLLSPSTPSLPPFSGDASPLVPPDPMVERLWACHSEVELLDTFGRSPSELNEQHALHALSALCVLREQQWQWWPQQQRQKQPRPQPLGSLREHPQFGMIRTIVVRRLYEMGDDDLVGILSAALRLKVDHHDSLVQELTVEGCRRIDRLPLLQLSKLAMSLMDQQLHRSRAAGRIAERLRLELHNLNIRVLSKFMLATTQVVSAELRLQMVDAAIEQLDKLQLQETSMPSRATQEDDLAVATTERMESDGVENWKVEQLRIYRSLLWMLKFLQGSQHMHQSLVDSIAKHLTNLLPVMNIAKVCTVLRHLRGLSYNSTSFNMAARERLQKLMPPHSWCDDGQKSHGADETQVLQELDEESRGKDAEIMMGIWANPMAHPQSALRVFTVYGPLAGPDIRRSLEKAILKHIDRFSKSQSTFFMEGIAEMRCKNPLVIQKAMEMMRHYLPTYRTTELVRATQAALELRCVDTALMPLLASRILALLQSAYGMNEAGRLVRLLAILPMPAHAFLGSQAAADVVSSRMEALIPQASLADLANLGTALAKWHSANRRVRTLGADSRLSRLLPQLRNMALSRLEQMESLDAFLEEHHLVKGTWFTEAVLQEAMLALRRLAPQVHPGNLLRCCELLISTYYLQPEVLDSIAAVAMHNIKQIHYKTCYTVILLFALMNYEPPNGEEFFNVCIEHITPHLDQRSTFHLLLLGYVLSLLNIYPESLTRTIFSLPFLTRLDRHMELVPENLQLTLQDRLMELNRNVCLEAPEFRVPWFHERHCQQSLTKERSSTYPVKRQIYSILCEVLGGISFAKLSAITPYYHVVDFECILDKQGRPVPYVERGFMLGPEATLGPWASGDAGATGRRELPPGAQRIAVQFLDGRAFCKGERRLKGPVVAKMRHLEILGYRVVQIPHFELNSMELSSRAAWVRYIKEKLFAPYEIGEEGWRGRAGE
ncbi:FAST kinase domain-containing protein 1, mitochondrial isoform X1 [Lampetra fluviatilis]